MSETKTPKTKAFDCVEMKRQVQKKILDEIEGHSPEEQVDIIKRLAAESPFVQRLRKAKTKSAGEDGERKTG